MVIEWLKFRVDPEQREQLIQQDAAIWTTALAQYPGFLSKEVWISPDRLTEVIAVIHWQTYEQWKAIPAADLERIEAQLAAALSDTDYAIVESTQYQVRKFYDPEREKAEG